MQSDVVMVMFNPSEKAVDSVLSLIKHNQGMNRLILVDNCSTNKTNIIRIAGLPDMLITLKTQTSLAGAWNAGLAYTNTDYAVITNDDIIFTDNWLPPLIRAFEADKELGYVQPYNTLSGLPDNFPNNYIKQRKVGDIPKDNFVGCCFAIRKDMYNKIKEYDKRWADGDAYTWFYEPYFPLGAEDQDFILRVKAAGFKVQTAFDSYIHHYSAETTRQYGEKFAEIRDKSDSLFRQRWDSEPVYKDFKNAEA